MSTHEFNISRPGTDPLPLRLDPGQSIVVIGANGSGKTRLGVHLEKLSQKAVIRIAAHKSLILNDKVNLVSLERAKNTLFYGAPDDASHKDIYRWGKQPAVHLLNDFDALLQSLFAEASQIAIAFVQQAKLNPDVPVPTMQLERLKAIWQNLLRHRELRLLEASIEVLPYAASEMQPYAASQMSDGERAIFYFIGQCLVAQADSLIIVDEPEAHVHKALLAPLWNAIEQARPDCAFIYITHDLDFAVMRSSVVKCFVRAYSPPASWEIDELPNDTGLPEHLVAELVGSRTPVLFVEGERGSLDFTIYSHQYAEFTVIPAGPCEAVIHSVASYKASPALHRFDARGIVDADHQTPADIENLRTTGVYVLPVAEVENLLLLPDPFLALAAALACDDPAMRLATLRQEVLKLATEEVDRASARYATRQIDRRLKRLTVKAQDLATLENGYKTELSTIDPGSLFDEAKRALEQAIKDADLAAVLRLYDNKGLFALAARVLGISKPAELHEKVRRLLGSDVGNALRKELTKVLPVMETSAFGAIAAGLDAEQ